MQGYLCRPLKRPVRLRVRTPPFHGGYTSSNLVRATRDFDLSRSFFIMITVYVIESLMDQTWYTGMAKDVTNRLLEHNSGKNRFTKGHRPWKIIYTEIHPDWENARKREKYLKSASGKIWLRKYLSMNSGDTSSLPA